MKKIALVLIVILLSAGIVYLMRSSNSNNQTAAAILSNQKNTLNTTTTTSSKTIAVSPTKPVDITTSTERKLRITVINGQCVYQIRNWILGAWNIVQVSPYDTSIGACPGLQSVL